MKVELSEGNLKKGLKKWNQRENFPTDLHNHFYKEEICCPSSGIADLREWWETTCIDALGRWKALRGLKGFTKAKAIKNGHGVLKNIKLKLDTLNKKLGGRRGSEVWMKVEWCDVAPLFELANGIKFKKDLLSKPPTFGSKMCHYLFPQCYPVFDQKFLGIGMMRYRSYWKLCHQAWLDCPAQQKKRLREIVTDRIRKYSEGRKSPISSYPYAIKIVELCVAGAHTKKCSGN